MFLCALAVILSGCTPKDVATVNGARITNDEFVEQLEKDYGHEVLLRMIDRVIIDDAFEKAGFTFPQEKLEAQIQEARDQAGSEEAFQQWLMMQGRNEEDLRLAIEMGMKLEMIGQKDIQLTEEDLKAYYKENQLRYDEPLRVTISEIVRATKADADDVYEKATKPDASFSDLAKQYSIAPTQRSGGRRPTMVEEQIMPVEIRDDALTLEPGKVSKPIQTGGELWYIIQVHERLPAKKLTFEEARERVETDYKRERMDQTADVVQELRSQASVRILAEGYADLQRTYVGADLLRGAPTGEPGSGIPAPPTEGERPTGAAPDAGDDAAPTDEADTN